MSIYTCIYIYIYIYTYCHDGDDGDDDDNYVFSTRSAEPAPPPCHIIQQHIVSYLLYYTTS